MAIVSSMKEEIEQIEAAKRDRRAFAPLYTAYADLVWRYAMRRLGDAEMAAEVTSVTFARALAALPTFKPRCHGNSTTLRAWLMAIARNAVIDTARRERPTISLEDQHTQQWLVGGQATPEDLAIAGEERRQVMAALARLPETQRRIVEMRLIGMKAAEIADTLGMSVSAVNTAHFRAYARLRDLLADAGVHRGSAR